MLRIAAVTVTMLLAATSPAAAPTAPPPISGDVEGSRPPEHKAGKDEGKAADKAEAKEARPEGKDARPEGKDVKAEGKDVKAEGKPEPRATARSERRERSKSERKPERADKDKADKPVAAEKSEGGALPPTLSGSALRDELQQNRGEARDAVSEREKLEALSADLARARAALRAETARLEALLQKGRPAGPGGGGGGGAGELGPMPIGDPMAPQKPQVTPVTSLQVDPVSKALKGMKPEQAAALIAHLDRSLAAEVLARMRPADAGVILGFLRPELGAALATEIASRPPAGAAKGKTANKEKL